MVEITQTIVHHIEKGITMTDIARLVQETGLQEELVLEALGLAEEPTVPKFKTLEEASEATHNLDLHWKIRDAARAAWQRFSSREARKALDLVSAVKARRRMDYGHLMRNKMDARILQYGRGEIGATVTLGEALALRDKFKELGVYQLYLELDGRIAKLVKTYGDVLMATHLIPRPDSEDRHVRESYPKHPILIKWRKIIAPSVRKANTYDKASGVRERTPKNTSEREEAELKMVKFAPNLETIQSLWKRKDFSSPATKAAATRWLDMVREDLMSEATEKLEARLNVYHRDYKSSPEVVAEYIDELINNRYLEEIRDATSYEKARSVFSKARSEMTRGVAILRMAELLENFSDGKAFWSDNVSNHRNEGNFPEGQKAFADTLALKAKTFYELLWNIKEPGHSCTEETRKQLIRRIAPFYPKVEVEEAELGDEREENLRQVFSIMDPDM
ncbi:MAG: hypothetical protein Q8O98_02420 [bacterium]|nr:hypothetical protein [bacterium]